MDYVSKHAQQMNKFVEAQSPKSTVEEQRLKVDFTQSEIDKKKNAILELQDELAYLEGSLSALTDDLGSLG